MVVIYIALHCIDTRAEAFGQQTYVRTQFNVLAWWAVVPSNQDAGLPTLLSTVTSMSWHRSKAWTIFGSHFLTALCKGVSSFSSRTLTSFRVYFESRKNSRSSIWPSITACWRHVDVVSSFATRQGASGQCLRSSLAIPTYPRDAAAEIRTGDPLEDTAYPKDQSCSSSTLRTSTLSQCAARCIGVALCLSSSLASPGRVSIILFAMAETKLIN